MAANFKNLFTSQLEHHEGTRKRNAHKTMKEQQENTTWSLQDPYNMGSLPKIKGVMALFFERVMETPGTTFAPARGGFCGPQAADRRLCAPRHWRQRHPRPAVPAPRHAQPGTRGAGGAFGCAQRGHASLARPGFLKSAREWLGMRHEPV